MKCPGQDSQYWKPGAIYEADCPKCGHGVEFFKDDPTRRCPKCGHRFVNPKMDFGCAAYCPFADQCVGELPPEVVAQRQDLIKDRVAVDMKRYFKNDFKRIGHATRVARYAERIGKDEGGNMAVIRIAAYLHDIGLPEAEKKYGSSGVEYREKEGPPVAKRMLKGLGAPNELIEEVCDIIAHHHHPGPGDNLNFKVVFDADRIADMEESMRKQPMASAQLEEMIETKFLTKSGTLHAKKLLLDK
ncbi:MAG: HD domain-containing protein [Desulfobacterales bacterium]